MDPSRIEDFVTAQAACAAQVRAEIAAGRKASHWMWFVFPQLAGLGTSAMAQRYALRSVDEAREFLAHPQLGPRLRELTGLVLAVPDRTAHEIFGSPDDFKFHSCLTLFAAAAPTDPVFSEALAKYFAGKPDPRTVQLLASA